jgi:hypothetical protein
VAVVAVVLVLATRAAQVVQELLFFELLGHGLHLQQQVHQLVQLAVDIHITSGQVQGA